jgi:hypothetical protein
MAIDYYEEARQIITALKSEGLLAEADAVREVMEAGVTATEILMGVRWQLKQIDGANKTANVVTKRKIRDLVEELNKVLS